MKNLKDKFKNKALFDQALTHKSWVNENPEVRGSNERLEFLGDAVLELIVTDYLYKKFPEQPEGYLTALRANIVNTINLAKFAKKINLGEEIFLSKGESYTNGVKNNSLLADSVEAVIGAIYLDQGIKLAREFIEANLLSDLESKLKEPLKDAKSRLQEMVQAKGLSAPKYKVINIIGPDHDRNFEIEVWVNGKVMGAGIGKNKSEAEQKAANLALEKVSV
jgi:ribonuclease III